MKDAFSFERRAAEMIVGARELNVRRCWWVTCIAVAIAAGSGVELRAQSGWQSIDIGTTRAGSTTEAGGVIAISGSGRDIWDAADSFRYHYREVTGEFDFRVRVRSLQHTWDWAKAGIMARQSINPGSPHDMVCITPTHGTAYQWRQFANGSSSTSTPTGDGGPPRWLRLARTGGGSGASYLMAGYTSADGINWRLEFSRSLSYSGPLLVGLAVTSHVDGVLCRAEFEQFSSGLPPAAASNTSQSSPGIPAAPTNLSANTRSATAIELTWGDATNETRYEIERSTEGANFSLVYTTAGADQTTWTDAGLTAARTYYYRVRAVNSSGASAYSNITSATTSSVVAPPAAPSNLVATTVSNREIRLTWTDNSTNESWFIIEYYEPQVARVTGITASPNATSRIVTLATPGWAYSFVIRAVNSAGESANSNTASASTLPNEAWLGRDIGAIARPGRVVEAGAAVTIEGSGADIWERADEFFFYNRSWNGDGVLTARVTSLTNTYGWAKGGLMFRETASANARHAMMLVSAEHGTAFQYRNSTGGESAASTPTERGGTPHWLRIVREGDVFTGYESADGVNWNRSGSVTLPGFASSFYVGLAVTSHNDGVLCTARFENINLAAGGAPPMGTVPAAPSGLAATAPAYDRVNLAWADNASSEDGYEVQASTNATVFSKVGEAAANSTGTTVLNLTPEVTYYFRVRAFNAAGNSAFSNVVSVTTPPEPAPSTLAAPTNLRLTSTTSSTVRLAWTDNATSEIGYHVGLSSDGVNFSWAGTFANATSIEVTGLQPSTTYHFRVRAYQNSANGLYYIHSQSSNTVSATTTAAPPPPVPPNAPSNLVATVASSSQINLTWSDNSNNENGFEIVRSTDNRTFSHLAGPGANVTSYADTGLAPSTTYYYYVRALNSAGPSAATATVSATTQASSAPPITWQSIDVGDVGAAGSTSVSGTAVTIRGSGADIWDTSDAFHFHSRPLTGDGEISVQVLALDNTDTWAKAGVMLRASNEPGAPYVFIYVNPSFTIAWQHRETTGGLASSNGTWGWPNASLKIVRTGNTFGVYYVDGSANWALARTFSFSMPTTIRAGVAVTSHRRGTLANASFERLSVRQAGEGTTQPPQTLPATPSALAATIGSAGEVGLSWVDNATNENGYEIHRATDGGSAALLATIGPSLVAHTDSTVQPGHGYIYTVRAINAAGASAFSNSAAISTSTTVVPPPAPSWLTANIGNFGLEGSFVDGTTITVRGSGEDIWANADGFFYAYKPLRGDGQIVARVQGMENTHTWAKAGLMIRESLAAGSRHAFVFMTYNNGGLFHARTAIGGSTSIVEGPWWADAPYWLKIERRGNTFTAHTSADGVTWTLLTTETIDMGADALIGLAVTAHDVSKINTATFTEVQISSP